MPIDFPGDDPKTVWRSQSIEVSTMTLEKIRQKARGLQSKTRRELLGSLTVAFCYVFCIKEFPLLQKVLSKKEQTSKADFMIPGIP